MNGWKECKLEEICNKIDYGYTASATQSPIGPKFLRITDITSGKVEWESVPFCQINEFDNIKYKLNAGDIVVARTGATTGVTYTVKPSDPDNLVFASYLIRYRVNVDIADPFFIGHLLTSSIWHSYVDGVVGGSAQPGANAKVLGSFSFDLPPLPEQQAIAGVLGSLDDKIDLLTRQNRTLESMAETLFRQWFIEEAKDDWEEGTLGDFIDTTSGGTPSRKVDHYFTNGSHKWVKSKELNGSFIFDTEEKITDDGLNNSSAKLLDKHTILIALYGATVGEYGILAEPATCNQAVCAIIPNENYPYTFLFSFIKNNKDYIISLSSGSAQQNISQVVLRNLGIIFPNPLIIKFHKTVESLFEKIQWNSRSISYLKNLRDTLLPKLMSGEVRVRN